MNPLKQKTTMKKNSFLWAALSMTAALVMTACSSDNDVTETPQAPSTSKTIPYTVTVGSGDATTRATVNDNPSNRELYFATGDKLYITGTNIKGVLDLQSGDEGKASDATFSGELTYTGEGSPADNLQLTATLVSAQQRDGEEVTINATTGAVTVKYPTTAYCSSINDAVQKYSKLTGTSTYVARAFTLTQHTAFLNFEITFEDGTAAETPLTAVVSNGGSTIATLSVTTVTDNGVKAKFVLPLAAGTTLSSATVTMGGKAPIAFGASQTLEGKVYNVRKTQAAAAPAVTDLSMVDCAGNARNNGMWTANCYMVHTAGKYKLPLVYGNAIKDGADNTVAYNPGEKESTLPYCANFVNHADVAITSPWIKDNKDATNNNINVTQAELLWQDAEGLVTAVGIDGDYLTLTVGKDATTQEGNALIAAKDADGTIVWSWQIWVTKQTFAAATLTAVNTGSHTYSVTPVNLGWVGDATSATGYQTFYEWGRKDPFMGKGEVASVSNNTATIADNIKNPTTFYIVNTYKPSTAEYYNLWDAQQTGNTDNIATPTIKTVYDPSPAGFCVPTGNLFYYIRNFNNDPAITFVWVPEYKCRNLSCVTPNLFFPASGFRARGKNGSLDGVGTTGYYWSAHAYTTKTYGHVHGQEFYFISNQRKWDYAYRANGFSVRAVAEE
jgi:hypothetical protein